MRVVTLGVLGCGTVGGGFVQLLARNRELIARRTGVDLHVKSVAVRDVARSRTGVAAGIITGDAAGVVRNGVDVVVELIGGTEPAGALIREALWSGKHVVTANKALLAHSGDDLISLAETHRVQLAFEASVCGAIPVVRVIRDALTSDRIRGIRGVLNGTSNYILSQMHRGRSFADALRAAQSAGFAEADPSLDISGDDAAQKLTILSRLAFPGVPFEWNRREGIEGVTREDVARAQSRREVLRHVATARLRKDRVELDMCVRRLTRRDALAPVEGEQNGVVIDTEAAGELAFYGAGAGSFPSATSVLADVIEVARR